MSRFITLTTDFGYRDPYVGIMKGVILGRSPDSTIIDLTHGIAPHSVLEANFSIKGSFRFFPKGTVHVVVIDPGVGGDRKILFLEKEGHCFLAPDNGVLTGFLEGPEMPRSVENRSLFLDEVSGTFHGRDIFAPVAAGVANGLDPADLGPHVPDPLSVSLTEPSFDENTIEGCVVYIDVFGNLLTNITRVHIEKLGIKKPRVFLCGREIGEPQPSYSIKSKGEPVAIIGSFGHLEIAVNEGNAADAYSAGTGDEVTVTS